MNKFEYLDLITDEPYIIGQKLGFKDLTKLHNSWIKNIMGLNGNEDYTLLAHRGSYKTTCLTIAVALMLILEPHKNICIHERRQILHQRWKRP